MLYPTAKASYMYIHDMYSAIQLVSFGHMHTLHMLCNIKTKDFEYKRKLTMLTAELLHNIHVVGNIRTYTVLSLYLR